MSTTDRWIAKDREAGYVRDNEFSGEQEFKVAQCTGCVEHVMIVEVTFRDCPNDHHDSISNEQERYNRRTLRAFYPSHYLLQAEAVEKGFR